MHDHNGIIASEPQVLYAGPDEMFSVRTYSADDVFASCDEPDEVLLAHNRETGDRLVAESLLEQEPQNIADLPAARTARGRAVILATWRRRNRNKFSRDMAARLVMRDGPRLVLAIMRALLSPPRRAKASDDEISPIGDRRAA